MLRFHITSGARLSLRGAAPLVGGIVLTLGLSPDPGATLEAVARHLTTLKHPGSPALALALILGGAVGNFSDRILRGEVVDFMHIRWWGGYAWPDFNFADMFIVVGVAALIMDLLASEAASRAGTIDPPD